MNIYTLSSGVFAILPYLLHFLLFFLRPLVPIHLITHFHLSSSTHSNLRTFPRISAVIIFSTVFLHLCQRCLRVPPAALTQLGGSDSRLFCSLLAPHCSCLKLAYSSSDHSSLHYHSSIRRQRRIATGLMLQLTCGLLQTQLIPTARAHL